MHFKIPSSSHYNCKQGMFLTSTRRADRKGHRGHTWLESGSEERSWSAGQPQGFPSGGVSAESRESGTVLRGFLPPRCQPRWDKTEPCKAAAVPIWLMNMLHSPHKLISISTIPQPQCSG